MRFDKFTLKVQEALQEAQGIAGQAGHQALDVEHLILSFLRQPEGIVSEILKKLGADPRRVEGEIQKALDRLPRVEGTGTGQTYMTPRLNKVLDNALAEAARLTDEYVSAEHVLIAVADEQDGAVKRVLNAQWRHKGCDLQGPCGYQGQPEDHGPKPGGEIPGAEALCT